MGHPGGVSRMVGQGKANRESAKAAEDLGKLLVYEDCPIFGPRSVFFLVSLKPFPGEFPTFCELLGCHGLFERLR